MNIGYVRIVRYFKKRLTDSGRLLKITTKFIEYSTFWSFEIQKNNFVVVRSIFFFFFFLLFLDSHSFDVAFQFVEDKLLLTANFRINYLKKNNRKTRLHSKNIHSTSFFQFLSIDLLEANELALLLVFNLAIF